MTDLITPSEEMKLEPRVPQSGPEDALDADELFIRKELEQKVSKAWDEIN